MHRSGQSYVIPNLQSCRPNIPKLVLIGVCTFLQGQKNEGCMLNGNNEGHSPPSLHTCRTKEIFSSFCGDTFANIALRLPWTVRQKKLSLSMRPPEANMSLVELLVRNNFFLFARCYFYCLLVIVIVMMLMKHLCNLLFPCYNLQDDSEVTSDEENCLTQDEIQAFLERNQSFYNNRDQYRQLLKEKFTNYCRNTGQSNSVCGKWLTTTSVN